MDDETSESETDDPSTIPVTAREAYNTDNSLSNSDSLRNTTPNRNQVGKGKYIRLRFSEVECKRAFRNAFLCKSFVPQAGFHDIGSVLHWMKKKLHSELPPILAQHHGLKVWVSMLNTYENPIDGDQTELPIQTHSNILMNDWSIPDLIRNLQLQIIQRNAELIRLKSKLNFCRTEHLTIKAAQWDMGPGRRWQEMPPLIEKKKCTMNIKNEDEKCFHYAISAFLLRREAVFERRRRFIAAVLAEANGQDSGEVTGPRAEDEEVKED